MSLYESGDSSGVVSLKDICDDKSISFDKKVNLFTYIRHGFRSGLRWCNKT